MPRASYYVKHKKKLLKQQTERRERIRKGLAELERLEKLQQQKLDLESFESIEVKRIVRKQIIEDREDLNEKIEVS
jgi:hypothetical protein